MMLGTVVTNLFYHDWLHWHNPFSEAIQKETNLVPKFKHAEMTAHLQEQITWLGFAPSVVEGEVVPEVRLLCCSFEAQWTCTEDLSILLKQVLFQ